MKKEEEEEIFVNVSARTFLARPISEQTVFDAILSTQAISNPTLRLFHFQKNLQ